MIGKEVTSEIKGMKSALKEREMVTWAWATRDHFTSVANRRF